MVIELPPGPLICIAMDLGHRWILDMGLPGPDAERALLVGGISAAGPVERSLLWALGIFVVFAPLAVAMYRRRT